jgi:hypothetical protein
MLSQEPDTAGPSRLTLTSKHGMNASAEGKNIMLGGTKQEEAAAVMIQKHYRGHMSRQQAPHPQL